MVSSRIIDINAPSVQTHIINIQNVISRMATNSAGCKGICVALVSAVCAVAASNDKGILWAGIIPIIIFCALDLCYLALEQGFRSQYKIDVKNIHLGEFEEKELFRIPDPTRFINVKSLLKASRSWSVWLVYPSMIVLLIFMQIVL